MPANEIDSYRDPLDLLRRFVPTPLRVEVLLDFARVILETNDLSFFPASGAAAPQMDTQLPRCLWTLIRDCDIHLRPTEASIVMAGSVIVYSLGPACIIAADRERHEVLAFVGAEIDSLAFQELIFPVLVRLTEFVTHPHKSEPLGPGAGVCIGDTCNA